MKHENPYFTLQRKPDGKTEVLNHREEHLALTYAKNRASKTRPVFVFSAKPIAVVKQSEATIERV